MDTVCEHVITIIQRNSFLVLCTSIIAFSQVIASELNRNIQFRGGLQNARIQFEQNKKGRIAFIGGSITQMNGYRPMVSQWLKRRFPETNFEFINAGISSTCSHTGAFRLNDHVLSKGQIDLLFIEFAVNDDQDARHSRRSCILGMEGIIRQAKIKQPQCDLVVTHFVNPNMLKQIQSGKIPQSIEAHEKVLKHYDISSLFLAREVADQIKAGSLTWSKFGGTHPKPAGNSIAKELIKDLLDHAWSKPLPEKKQKTIKSIPKNPIDSSSFFNGRFLNPNLTEYGKGWKWHVPDWKNIPGGFRNTFAGMKLLCSDQSNNEVTFEFEGRAIGAYVLAGPDAGVLEVSIDNEPFKSIDLYHNYSRGLHYPRTVMFATDLDQKIHLVRLRLAKPKDSNSKRQAARILQFTLN